MIDYEASLNPQQLAAVTSQDPSSLVIAGAGSGKTRVIVYRLAWMIEHGVSPESILLLTFTRKAAQQMLDRAGQLLGQDMRSVPGGTFHSFAYSGLRIFPPRWLNRRSFTLLDSADITKAIKQCKDDLKIGRKDTSFPKAQTIASIISKARNKELSIEELLRRESFHLLPHAETLEAIFRAYAAFRQRNGLMDYDDLLFEMERVLQENGHPAKMLRSKISQILVDEYQDTNLVQARIVRLLAGEMTTSDLSAQVMAVGDDAQSIYAFRGANVQNILDFPKIFPHAGMYRLEENYRSTQPILNAANNILANSPMSFKKHLFTRKEGGEAVKVITPMSDGTQAQLALARIQELLQNSLPADIAVLFRAGFHSYPLENELQQAGIPFKKYGGLKLVEAAHIKDVLSFARLAINPLDQPAFSRIAAMHKGIGPKTIEKIHRQILENDHAGLEKSLAKHAGLKKDFEFFDEMRKYTQKPGDFFLKVLEHYRPRLETLYPEDWPQRLQGLEEILQIARNYVSVDLLVADMALESPESDASENNDDCVTLSTVHSAKGLEWSHVLVIDLVEDRFPSRHALTSAEEFEEERRLFYVACTRAKKTLDLYSPATFYSRQDFSSIPARANPFLQDIKDAEFFQENYQGKLVRQKTASGKKTTPAPHTRSSTLKDMLANVAAGDYCRHRIFGKGKILEMDGEKAKVDFPGLGVKTILCSYLQMED